MSRLHFSYLSFFFSVSTTFLRSWTQ